MHMEPEIKIPEEMTERAKKQKRFDRLLCHSCRIVMSNYDIGTSHRCPACNNAMNYISGSKEEIEYYIKEIKYRIYDYECKSESLTKIELDRFKQKWAAFLAFEQGSYEIEKISDILIYKEQSLFLLLDTTTQDCIKVRMPDEILDKIASIEGIKMVGSGKKNKRE